MLTMTGYMVTNFLHCLTNCRVRVQKHVMLPGVPFAEGGNLLRDSGEKAYNDANWSRLHVIAELLYYRSILQW